jgi:triacylglycerol lipase
MGGWRSFVVVAPLALALAIALSGPAAAKPHYPVPWTGDFSRQSESPNAPPVGSNDWSCEPTRRHPNPVILVHGWAANRTVNFPTISPFLANHGFCVFALTYGTKPNVRFPGYQPGGLRRMQRSARQLQRFAARVLERTGAAKVDIVGHSEVVDDYVGITPLWDGTNLAGLGTIDQIGQAVLGTSEADYSAITPGCDSCHQFLSGSRFIRRMNADGGPRVPGVDYTMLLTANDELVFPYTSGLMEGADNVVVQDVCNRDQSEHLSIAFDPTAAYTILNALDPRRPRPVPCVLVLPFIGAPGYSE